MAKKTKHLIEDLFLEAIQARAVGKIITVGAQRKPRKCVEVAYEWYYTNNHDHPDFVFIFANGEKKTASMFGAFTVLENT